ncbi:MAG: amidophosphoribosyltransferase, partial [Subdoligranulum sp.]|nr:amidophosphoribosyltransferase [Subdoligranulum sp.]
GTTSARTIKLLRDAGAKEVHYRISAPPFAHPCYFGTDIPDEKDLIATGHTVEEIRQIVGADSLGYLSIEHVTQLAIHSKCGFCTGCFTGHYPVPAPNETMDIVYDKPLSQSQTKKRL